MPLYIINLTEVNWSLSLQVIKAEGNTVIIYSDLQYLSR